MKRYAFIALAILATTQLFACECSSDDFGNNNISGNNGNAICGDYNADFYARCPCFRAQLNDWLARPGVPPRKLGFVVMMIDHGFAFNGSLWNLTDSALTGLYPRRIVYQNVRSIADFEPWIERIRGFPPTVLDRALRRIPPEWTAEDGPQLEALLESLLRRRARAPELIEQCRKAPGDPFPRWV